MGSAKKWLQTHVLLILRLKQAKRKKGIGAVTAAKSQGNEILRYRRQETLVKGCSTMAATDKGQTREERCPSQNQICHAILLLFLSNKVILIHGNPSSCEKDTMSSISTWLWQGNLNLCRQCAANQCLWYKGVCDSGQEKSVCYLY